MTTYLLFASPLIVAVCLGYVVGHRHGVRAGADHLKRMADLEWSKGFEKYAATLQRSSDAIKQEFRL